MSQLEVASRAEVSARHLSFVETGRSLPSKEMILRLTAELDVSLRDRNRALLAAGYAPAYAERPLDAPELASARAAIRQVLDAHNPFPALLVDRRWNIVDGNAGLAVLLSDVPAGLLEPPVNALRLTFHPEGLAARIDNLDEWREHVLARLRHQVAASDDESLRELLRDLETLGNDRSAGPRQLTPASAVSVPLRLRTADRILSFLSITTVFGAPLDVTLTDLAIEAFYPADESTAEFLNASRRSLRQA